MAWSRDGSITPDSRSGRGTILAEIGAVFAVAAVLIWIGIRWAGGDALRGQAAIWAAYLAMAIVIHLGLRRRGRGWAQLGLRWGRPSARSVGKAIVQSIVVFVAAVAAFVLGSVLGAPLFGLPAQADLSKYAYLQGNLSLLLAALPVVWIVSSLGEEIVFRGFLITRIAELLGAGRMAWRLAVVGSAVLFGFAHYAWGPTGIVQTTFMGLALGVAYLAIGRNLWVMVLAHVYLDTMLLVPIFLGGPPAGG